MANYHDDIENIEYGKSFKKDPKFNQILSDTSIDDKVTITKVHKNINSLAAQLEKTRMDAHKQIKGLNASISSTAKQQQKILQQIKMKELSSSKEIKVVEKSVQQILGKLGYTVDVLGKTSKKILIDTARTTKESLKEYGQAISSEFSINKTNFIAMTLAKATPIFGYFAGKFMETSVFKHFSELIKEKLTAAVSFSGNKIKDVWSRIKERKYSKKDKNREELPKLQSGGYVKTSGAAVIHAAEVVTPIPKLKLAFSEALKPLESKIVTSPKLQLAFSEALRPLIDKVGFITSYIKWHMFGSVIKFGYSLFKRTKYHRMISKKMEPAANAAQNIATFLPIITQSLDNSEKSANENNENLNKIKKATEGTEHRLGFGHSMMKKSIGSVVSWLMIGFGFLKTAFGGLLGLVGKGVSFLAKIPALLLGRKVLSGGGVGGGGVLKKAKKIGKFGRLGGTVGGIFAALDAFEGMGESENWKTSKASSAIGGFLGGSTEGGAMSAVSGMAKGAGIGMMFGPIGAGIGALTGGLLGLVGGKNIAKGTDWVWGKVKNLSKSVIDVMMFPFKILEDLKNRFMDWIKDPKKSVFEKAEDCAKQIANTISWPVRIMTGVGANVLEWIVDKIPDTIKKFIPDFILKGIYTTIDNLKKSTKGFEITSPRKQPSISHQTLSAESAVSAASFMANKVKQTSLNAGVSVGGVTSRIGTAIGQKTYDVKEKTVETGKKIYGSLRGGISGLLERIAAGEGTSDSIAKKKGFNSGYDVSLGYGAYGGGLSKPLSQMTFGEVKQYQKRMLMDPKNTMRSSAVGKYQFVSGTLAALQRKLGYGDNNLFDASTQDNMAIQLLKERGINKFLSDPINKQSWFQNNLAQEWASIARSDTGRSHYGQHTGTSAGQIQDSLISLASFRGNTLSPKILQYDHAGSSSATESNNSKILTRNEVAKIQSSKNISESNLIRAGLDNYNNSALDLTKQNGKYSYLLVNNLTNVVSSAVNNLSKTLSSGLAKSTSSDSDLDRVVTANL